MFSMTVLPKRWTGYLLPIVALYWLAMFIGTHVPHISLPGTSTLVSLDKLLHFCGYLGLSFLLSLWLVATASTRGEGEMQTLRTRGYLILLFIAVYASLDEWTQLLVGRSCELRDWAADILGAFTGMLIVATWVAVRNDSEPIGNRQLEEGGS